MVSALPCPMASALFGLGKFLVLPAGILAVFFVLFFMFGPGRGQISSAIETIAFFFGSAKRAAAVGVVDANHLVIVVVDGRSTGYSAGVTLPELADIMVGLGAQTAYNLDGGGSSTMVFDGALVNNPLGKGDERGTSDILYLAR